MFAVFLSCLRVFFSKCLSVQNMSEFNKWSLNFGGWFPAMVLRLIDLVQVFRGYYRKEEARWDRMLCWKYVTRLLRVDVREVRNEFAGGFEQTWKGCHQAIVLRWEHDRVDCAGEILVQHRLMNISLTFETSFSCWIIMMKHHIWEALPQSLPFKIVFQVIYLNRSY